MKHGVGGSVRDLGYSCGLITLNPCNFGNRQEVLNVKSTKTTNCLLFLLNTCYFWWFLTGVRLFSAASKIGRVQSYLSTVQRSTWNMHNVKQAVQLEIDFFSRLYWKRLCESDFQQICTGLIAWRGLWWSTEAWSNDQPRADLLQVRLTWARHSQDTASEPNNRFL